MMITKLDCDRANSSREIHEQFAWDVLSGLRSRPKSLPTKYFYDDKGTSLFRQITRQDEYYLTRSEIGILRSIRDVIPKMIGEGELDVIDLGPGDGEKSKIVIDGLLQAGYRVKYYPIDISRKALEILSGNVKPDGRLEVHGMHSEYFEGLRFVRSLSSNRQLVLFLGSNIGNMNMEQGRFFLRGIAKSLNADDSLLIGFDLKKDLSTLTRAYNDAAGFTRDFNLNLLDRVNRELGGNFDLDAFEHYGVYNPVLGAMESYLISSWPQEVFIGKLQHVFRFAAFEPIHTEYSFKYLAEDIEDMCAMSGFRLEHNYYDEQRYFVDSLWSVVGQDVRAGASGRVI